MAIQSTTDLCSRCESAAQTAVREQILQAIRARRIELEITIRELDMIQLALRGGYVTNAQACAAMAALGALPHEGR